MADATVHPLALVEAGADLAADVVVGPFCHVGPRVVLGAGAELVSHVVLAGNTRIGARTPKDVRTSKRGAARMRSILPS